MRTDRTLVIGIDYAPRLIDRMSGGGELPTLTRLRQTSARFKLDHGAAVRSGLAWEHVATGRSPDEGGRASTFRLDPAHYTAIQEPTRQIPFAAPLDARFVVFDAPYFDLARAPNCQGIVNWAAHDPGVAPACRPAGLQAELLERFGPYPSHHCTYGFVWPDGQRAQAMADGLVRGLELRAEVARWLLGERFTDWDMGLVIVGETHSALEAMWHGVDPSPLMRGLPSTEAAERGLCAVYRALDRLLATLEAALPDVRLVVFAMHAMDANDSDVGSMLLLPELLHRWSFGRPHARPSLWPANATGVPVMGADEIWDTDIHKVMPPATVPWWRRWLGAASRPKAPAPEAETLRETSIDWMATSRYMPFWPRMRAFALPSFYDGRIRINLAGRESRGRVKRAKYDAVCDELTRLLRECREPIGGASLVRSVERGASGDPMRLDESGADLVVAWNDGPLGFDHPRLGRCGPYPPRRTGGHTGGYGEALIRMPGLAAADHGVRSAFDVVPTLIDMLGESGKVKVSGRSFWPELQIAR